MIWYVTNVDTELLALRTAIEALPDGFPPVRAGQPWTVDVERDFDDATCVIVRLLRGRRAWEAGFDRLRATLRRSRRPVPRLRRRSRYPIPS